MHEDIETEWDVVVVGAGVAGLTAAVFTARAGLSTLVCDGGESILRRNAHLENVPGFPAGVNPRLFADMLAAQADRNGAVVVEGRVASVDRAGDDAFDVVVTVDGEPENVATDRVIAASWKDASYLDGLDVESRSTGSKQYLQPDATGQTDVPGLYAAGRLAEQYHQTVVAAGHGAQVAITLVHDSETPFYNDWVVPEGYFTDRGREVPPGCEEIDETERLEREEASLATMREHFAEPHPDDPTPHPSLAADE